MAIHEEVLVESSGGKKVIDDAAMDMIMDNVQISQYRYPIKSTIRELVSNALDAINEKTIALQVLTGKAKPEDFYVTRDGAVYRDSHYMPEYYSEKWLSKGQNEVLIIYEEGSQAGNRDRLRVIDNGVGIGHIINPSSGKSRLMGILTIGYSTKRLNTKGLGKFGLDGA